MDSIKHSKLIDIGHFYGGLTGKSKGDFEDGNAKFITYMNVFSNPSLKIDVNDKVRIEECEKQNVVKYGDVIFTGSSETPDECGMSSVLEEQTDEPLYLNSFCFGYRFNNLHAIIPAFCKHLFRSNSIRTKIVKTANGVTRFNISKKLFGEIEIPVPSIDIQEKIANQLDAFSSIIVNLETELASRQKQYEYYRNKLLTFDKNDESVEWKTLGDVCNVITGGEPPKNSIKGNEPTDTMIYPIWANGREVYGYADTYTVEKDSVCISSIGANTGAVFFHKGKFTPIIRLKVLIPLNDKTDVRYLYYAVSRINFKTKKGSVPNMNSSEVKGKHIPIPSLQRQQEIVFILDTFESLITNLKAEIAARKKQYEYYREQLLRF